MSHLNPQVEHANYAVPAEMAGTQKIYLGIGVVGALACIAGYVMQPEQLMRGYLIGYMLWIGLSLGCMALLMVQHLSGGLWGLSIRRILEAASKGLPLMLVLFLPIVLGRHYLYEWMSGEGCQRPQRLVPEHAVLVAAAGDLLWRVDRHDVCAEQAVRAAG